MDGRQAPAVPGVERLQYVLRLLAADLPDDDVIRPVPQRVLDHVASGELVAAQVAGLQADAVALRDAQLDRVLDDEDAVLVGKELDERVEQRRLAASGPAGDEHVAAPAQRLGHHVQHRLRQRAHAHQVLRRELGLREPPDGDARIGRRRLDAQRHARAVRQARVDQGHLVGVLPQRAGDRHDQSLDVAQGLLAVVGLVELAQPLVEDQHAVRAADHHDLGDRVVLEQRGQGREVRRQIRDRDLRVNQCEHETDPAKAPDDGRLAAAGRPGSTHRSPRSRARK